MIRAEVLTAILLLLSYQSCLAQGLNVITNDKKLRYTRILGVARSTFDVNGRPSSPNYASFELRFGAGVVKPIGEHVELRSGLNLGVKGKRKSYFFGPSGQFTYEPWVLPHLDEAASTRNHFFVEIPLTLQFNPAMTGIGIRCGPNYRFWAPNNSSVDVLTAKHEIGVLGGISYKVIKDISIGLEYYYGLSSISGGSYISSNSQLNEFNVRNQFAQLTIEQTF